MIKKTSLSLFLLVTLLLSFNTCSSIDSRTGKTEKSSKQKPVWLDLYPKDERYYIGIGSSNTGNQAEDMELARAKAMSALAASISTTIQSEQTFTTIDTSEGNSFESAEIVIREAVDQNLQAVEIYDSYYSTKEGYWFYVRLNKLMWAEIQRKEMEKVIQRTLSVIEPHISNIHTSIAKKLTALGAGWEIVALSPYTELLEIDSNGRKVTLIDYIENAAGSILEDVSIECKNDTARLKIGSPYPLELSVRSRSGSPAGKLPFRIRASRTESIPPKDFTTDYNGDYMGELEPSFLGLGDNSFLVSMDMDKIGIRVESFRNKIIVPSKEIRIEVEKLEALLVTKIPEKSDVPGIYESVKSVLSLHLPFDLIADKKKYTDYTIEFVLAFRDIPENDFGISISYCKAIISIIHKGSNIYSFETEEFKEGGLDYGQAHQRASKALLLFLKENNIFYTNFITS